MGVMKTKKKVQISIRIMEPRDLSQVFAIESQNGENKWTKEYFLRRLQARGSVGLVSVDESNTILSYMVYELHKEYIHISNITVDSKYHRKSLGFYMLRKVMSKLSEGRRTFMEIEVRESNLDAQLFLKKMGFECDDIIKDWFDNGDEENLICEDGYHFVYSIKN